MGNSTRIQKLVIELPLIDIHVERMISLGFSDDQIRKAAQLGLDIGNYYHWMAMLSAAALGEIDDMLENHIVWIKGFYPQGKMMGSEMSDGGNE